MKQSRLLMGMPITIEVLGITDAKVMLDKVFSYFSYVDEKFSTYKKSSEITLINENKLAPFDYSEDMKTILALAEKTKKETNGYFDIVYNEKYDPSGIVKGWAIDNAAKLLKKSGATDFFIDAGGDVQTSGRNKQGKMWSIGIRNPFVENEIVKTIYITNQGVATSGTYIRGNHIYNPKNKQQLVADVVSLTVIGPNIYDADRFATAAFAMGKNGIYFIEDHKGFEGYMIDKDGTATMTTGFEIYTDETNN